MKYIELKKRQEKEFNNFPMIWAFSKEQLKKGLEKFGLTLEDKNKLYSFGGGGFYLKTDSKKLRDLSVKHKKEFKQAIENDKTGEDFIFEMFKYELSNHEYLVTGDIEDTLDALCLSADDIEKNENLKHGLKLAIKNQREDW